MKKIYLFLPAIVFSYRSYSQMVVEAPMLETLSANQTTILGSMNVTMAAIEDARHKVEKLKESADWINKLESMQEFIQLLETTTCMAKDLDLNLRLALTIIGPRASCLDEFKYKININRLRYVVDAINLVLTNGFSMSREGRMQAYHDALTTFELAQVGLGDLTIFLRRIIIRYDRAKRYKDEILDVNDFNQYKK